VPDGFRILFGRFLVLLFLHQVIADFFELFCGIASLGDPFGALLHVLFHGLEVGVVPGQNLVVLLPLFELFVRLFVVEVVPLRVADFLLVVDDFLGLFPVFPIAAFNLPVFLLLFVLVHLSHEEVLALRVGYHLARAPHAFVAVLELLQLARGAVEQLGVFLDPVTLSLWERLRFFRDYIVVALSRIVIAVGQCLFGFTGFTSIVFPE